VDEIVLDGSYALEYEWLSGKQIPRNGWVRIGYYSTPAGARPRHRAGDLRGHPGGLRSAASGGTSMMAGGIARTW
jgi:hypothetical protein